MWLRNFMYFMGSYSTLGAYRVPCSCQGHGWSLSELGINSPTHCLPQLTFVVGLKGELSVLFLLNICFRIFLHVKSANLPWVSSPLFPPSFRICKNHLLSIHWHPDFGWLRLNHVKSPFWLAESHFFSGWTSPLSPWNTPIKKGAAGISERPSRAWLTCWGARTGRPWLCDQRSSTQRPPGGRIFASS